MSETFGQQQFKKQQFKHKASDLRQDEISHALMSAKLKLPANGLILTGGLSLLVSIGLTVTAVSIGAMQSDQVTNYWTHQIFGPMPADASLNTKARAELMKQRKSQGQMVVTLGIGGIIILGITLSGLYMLAVSGGILMKQLRNYRLARIACIVAMIPLISPLVVVGVPFGIWGLTKLSQPDIKKAFK